MRFPKEKVVIENKINQLLKENDYYGIFMMKDDILNNYQVLDQSVFHQLISSTFYIGNFDEVCLISNQLKAMNIESFEIIYYTILSLIANVDIYQAMSYVKKSKLLNNEDIKEFYTADGANYSNLLFLSDKSLMQALALLMVNFVEGLSREMTGNIDVDQEYIMFRFFDLINLVYEIGYPLAVIQELSHALKIIFNLEI